MVRRDSIWWLPIEAPWLLLTELRGGKLLLIGKPPAHLLIQNRINRGFFLTIRGSGKITLRASRNRPYSFTGAYLATQQHIAERGRTKNLRCVLGNLSWRLTEAIRRKSSFNGRG